MSVDLRELGRELARTDWSWVVAAMVIGLAGVYARAFRWRWLFPPGVEPTGIAAATMIGYMANNVLPLRAGEVVRIYVLARKLRESGYATGAEAFWLVTATLVVERVLDSLAIVSMLAVLVLMIPVPRVVEWGAGILLVVDVVGVSALIAVARAPDTCRRVLLRLTRRWPGATRLSASIFETTPSSRELSLTFARSTRRFRVGNGGVESTRRTRDVAWRAVRRTGEVFEVDQRRERE